MIRPPPADLQVTVEHGARPAELSALNMPATCDRKGERACGGAIVGRNLDGFSAREMEGVG